MNIRIIRESGFKDYLAIDLVDNNDPKQTIIETVFYLAKDKPIIASGQDVEEDKWFKNELTYDGEKISAKDIDGKSNFIGMVYEITADELCDFNIWRKWN